MQGVDILDQRDPVGKSFVGSLFFHGGLVALLVGAPYLLPKPITLGDPTHHSGSIGVSVVKTIPIPQREGPVNRVANDTKSMVPQEPEPPKPKPKEVVKEKVPPKEAIPIPTHEKKKPPKPHREIAETNPYRPPEPYKENQIFNQTPQAAKSDLYGLHGTGGIDVGQSNPFGEQYGWYAQMIIDRVSQKWNRANVTSRPHAKAVLQFALQRDGSVQNMRVLQASGSYLLDNSAQRAILDASPMPPFPRGFNYNSVNVELTFELQQ